MTRTTRDVPPFQQKAPADRIVKRHLLQLVDGAYAKAERSRRSWYRTRRTKTPRSQPGSGGPCSSTRRLPTTWTQSAGGCHEPG